MNIGDRILQFRIYLGLSRVDFAEKVAQDYDTIDSWETDKSTPSMENLAQMQKLGLNINWLISGYGKMYDISAYGIPIIPIYKIPKESFKIWLDEYWDKVDEAERDILVILFKRVFPEYNSWLEKKRDLEAETGILDEIVKNEAA